MKTQSAKASNQIKKILKSKFPGIKFSVRSDNYSGGSSVNVDWTDGPTREQVEEFIKEFQQGHFDGMYDIYEYSNSRDDIPQAKYVFANRELSKPIVLQASKVAQKHFGGLEGIQVPDSIDDLGKSFMWRGQWYNWHQVAWQVLNKIDLTGAVGIEEDPEFTGGGVWEGFRPLKGVSQ